MEKKLRALILKAVSPDDTRAQDLVQLCNERGFEAELCQTHVDALDKFSKQSQQYNIIISALGVDRQGSDSWEIFTKGVREANNKVFIAIFSSTACRDVLKRQYCFQKKCNMVTESFEALVQVLTQIKEIEATRTGKQKLVCAYCKESNFTEDSLWVHMPLYHCNEENIKTTCVVCRNNASNLMVHYRNAHGPVGRGEIQSENHKDIPLYAFSLTVVRRKLDGKYLVVQEFSNSGFWLPGGRVDPGESLQHAALRECREEAGIDIKLTGVLNVYFKHNPDYARMRVIFLAEPLDDSQLPKSVPDYESVGASYVTIDELKKIKLRGDEPLIWFSYVENGGLINPLSILTD